MPNNLDIGRLLSSYGFLGAFRLGLDLLYTRIFYPSARLIRRPNQVRGKRLIDFGKGLTTGRGSRIEAFPVNETEDVLIKFGSGVQINDYVHITAIQSVRIADRVLIASRVFISDHNHGVYSGDQAHSNPRVPPQERSLQSAPVAIEEDVWIGESVSILPGVTIGRGSIIGTQSVVNKSIPPFSIAAGIPARVIKKYNVMTRKWERA